ncbi:putative ribonuclease H-like domain-containing protein [Tanacetum coccineum]|uniref:Ribonuclease H-like domain-containing protein n=1 Tax=Tanacetum coccineum TaxID=301880 RepID=A0ABQ4Y5A8_9ASTR
MYDKKNSVLFTNTECVVLSPEFKLLDENHVLLRVPRKDNMYNVDSKNIVPSGGQTCLFAKATLDESNLWHRRLGHINFKTMNKLVRGNIVRGLPSKIFENNHTCVACQKGKQHKASYKTKTINSINQPLQMLHMDLFGLTFVKSLMKKMYCLVVTNDYSRFSWVFFLPSKDETSEILKTFIIGIENLIDLKVKVIRCDSGTEFKNKVMNQLYEMKDIKREFSVARTPQQNGVAERKNRTLIEAARTMLADSKLLTTFWAEAINTACYVQNRVLVIKPHNKAPYELFLGRKHALSFMRPFGCPVTILNTLDHLGKFDGKADERFFVGYFTNSKAFRVFNSRTRIVEENMHVKFSEETPNIAGNGPNWLFDIDALTISMNYKPVVAGNQPNGNVGTKENIKAGQARKKIVPDQEYILLPLLTSDPSLSKSSKDSLDAGFKPLGEEEKIDSEHPKNEYSEVPSIEEPRVNQEQDANVNNTNNINTVSPTDSTADIENNVVDENIVYGCIDDQNMPNLEEIVYSDDDEEVGVVADMNNLATTVPVSPILTIRVHKDHPLEQIIRDIHSAPQTRRMTKNVTEHVEPKNMIQALTDPSWIEAMQDELLQFKLQKRNKKDDRGIVVRNKARLVVQGYTQEEGIDYDEVFAPIDRIEAIRLFLAYATFMNFIVYQMDVKSAFLYGTIEEEVYVCQPLGFEDPEFPKKVYKVERALYGLHQAPRAWYETLSTYLLENRFRRGTIDKTLSIKKDKGDILLMQVKQKDDGIFISQDKYVADILKKFDFLTVRIANTPMETLKPLLKDAEAKDVDVHLYRSMIGSLLYLTAYRPHIMFVDSPFNLEAYSDSDYAGASLDRKSTIGGVMDPKSNAGLWIQLYLTFADSHNMVAYLEKSEDNVDFAEIVDFLNASPISSKSTTWNEFSTNIASAVICLAKKQKFNFSKLIFDALFNDEYDIPSHTKKDFENMKRQGKTFLGTVTPLFATMLIQSQAVEGEGSEQPTKPQHTHTTASPSHVEPIPIGIGSGGSPRRQDTIGDRPAQTRFERLSKQSNEPPLLRLNILGSGEDSMKLQELMDLYTKLSDRVLNLENGRNEIDQDEGISWFLEDSEDSGRYGYDIRVNTASTLITTANINITTAEPVTTASAPVTIAGVSVSTAEPSTPPTTTTTTPIEDEDLTIAPKTIMKMKSEK